MTVKSFISVQDVFRSFSNSDDGSLTTFFAASLVMLGTAISLSVDGGRAFNAYNSTGHALDAAALAAAKALNEQGLSDSELLDIARTVFESNTHNASSRNVAYQNLSLRADRETNEVSVSVEGNVKTTFAQLMNITEIPIATSAKATYNTKNIEMAMMLDVTGSMSGRKIRDLKVAATQLVDILIPDQSAPQKVRIALAPYSASVNVGSYAHQVSNGVSRDGCVYERGNSHAYRDTAPGRNAYFNAVTNPRRASNNKYGCPNAEILPLSDDKRLLERTINGYSVGGWTAGHLGTAWAWYLVSPKWQHVWPTESQPVSYSDHKTIKTVLLMTDGEFNTSYLNGRQNRTSNRQTRTLCDQMKRQGVQVYTVAFEAPASARRTLENCATSSDHSFNAENGAELIRVFKDIAVRLSKLRISE